MIFLLIPFSLNLVWFFFKDKVRYNNIFCFNIRLVVIAKTRMCNYARLELSGRVHVQSGSENSLRLKEFERKRNFLWESFVVPECLRVKSYTEPLRVFAMTRQVSVMLSSHIPELFGNKTFIHHFNFIDFYFW